MMKADFETRVKTVEWSHYSHPCMQDQSLIPPLLLQMVGGNEEQKLKAAERLWDIAAHQGNVGPSAVPAAEFLIEMLEELSPSVQGENLDTLYQFSNYLRNEQWGADLRIVFVRALPLFERLSTSENEDVCDFSNMIIENIRATEQMKAEAGEGPESR